MREIAGLRDLPQLAATFDLTPQGSGGAHVVGRVSAMVGQTCVVTLEPLLSPIEEDVDLLFLPQTTPLPTSGENEGERTAPAAKWNDPEPLVAALSTLGRSRPSSSSSASIPIRASLGRCSNRRGSVNSDGRAFAALAGWTKGRDRR